MATRRGSHGSGGSKSMKGDRLAADFQAFVGDVEQVLKSASHLPADGLLAARTRLEEKVAQARAQLADAGSAVASGVNQARDAGEAYLRDRPWTVIGVALVIGAVAGMLLARRG
jgi:ElaB/YqjD/DUF883 family membrane-anchored ribosome-binding protein